MCCTTVAFSRLSIGIDTYGVYGYRSGIRSIYGKYGTLLEQLTIILASSEVSGTEFRGGCIRRSFFAYGCYFFVYGFLVVYSLLSAVRHLCCSVRVSGCSRARFLLVGSLTRPEFRPHCPRHDPDPQSGSFSQAVPLPFLPSKASILSEPSLWQLHRATAPLIHVTPPLLSLKVAVRAMQRPEPHLKI